MRKLTPKSRDILIDRLTQHALASDSVAEMLRYGFCGFASMPDDYLVGEAAVRQVRTEDLEITTITSSTQEYRVFWEIDVSATDARNAAEVARYYQRPGTSADTFDVFDAKGDMTRVRLNEEDEGEE